MGCNSCGTTENGLPKGCKNNGACGESGCNSKLSVFDWLANMNFPSQNRIDIIEVRFKNGRKEFFKIDDDTEYFKGDIVAVEASPGHDIGIVSLTGEIVLLQLKKKGINKDAIEFKKVYRKAKQTDIDKWQAARDLEEPTMYKARTIAVKLNLQMKISDVEYQGDKTKAIFYYTADDRVDFRELIKVLADEFKIRIEMKQIGARQEASRLGGIGSCGRELCCSTWLTDFRSVSTSAARYQQLSLNPLKLAGQCGKLKCCLNYELDSYMDALKEFPENANKLLTKSGTAFLQKTDIFKKVMWYSYDSDPNNFIPLDLKQVYKILELNKNKEVAEDIKPEIKETAKEKETSFYENVVGQDDIKRFDKNSKKNKKNKKPKQNNQQEKQAVKTENQNKTIQIKENQPAQANNNKQDNNLNKPNNNSNQNKNRNHHKNKNRNKPNNRNENTPPSQ